MEWSGLEGCQCLEILSCKMDVEWYGLFFSKALPKNSYDVTDMDWDILATSLGLVSKLPPEVTTYQAVKTCGLLVLLGLGSYLCYKLCNVSLYQYRTASATSSRGDDDSSPPPPSFNYHPSSTNINVKTHYFGPQHKKNEDCEQSYSNSGNDVMQCQLNETMGQSARRSHRGWLSQYLVTHSPCNTTSTSSTGSSPISCHHSLSRDFSFDSLRLFSSSHRQSSLDSICSELSFDLPSFAEQTSENVTVSRLDKLQEEIDQIKSNCQIMDEEFETFKSNRNLPGLAELMETTEHINGDGQLSKQDIARQQSAKACFKGLYSLTTINHSLSMDEDVSQLSVTEEVPSLEWDDNNWTDRTSPMLTSKMNSSGYGSKMDLSSSLSGSGIETPGEEYSEAINSEMVRSMSCDRHLNIGSRLDILSYAEREWTGNTHKAKTILRGYSEIVESLQYRYIRLIRGDNYCALRSVIYQVLLQGLQVPSSSKTLAKLSSAHNIGQWKFNGLPYHGVNIIRGMEICLQSLDNICALCQSNESFLNDREETLYNLFNRDPSLDLHVMEAVKLHMMAAALDLHEANLKGQDVPFFSVLMFARDTSEIPTDFMNNHLVKVGDSGGLEQVEMYLLGYTLEVSVKVVRPSAHNTQQFICFYPDDNVGSWPEVTLVAEDDRHYNIICR